MALCKFFQQGYCKFGNSCRFEHPISGGNRGQSSNRFGAFGGGGGGGGSSSGGGNQDLAEKYNVTADTIERDLTAEVPQWIFSAYAPGRNAPGQLFGGYPREQSFEEIRFHYWTGKATGNEQQALNQAQELFQEAQQQMQNAVRNSKEAVQFVVQAENTHPNRNDVCKEGTQGAPFGEFAVGKRPKSLVPESSMPNNPFGSNATNASPFGGGAAAATTTSAFGQPSVLGQKPSPFSTSSFGQPSQAAANASPFGQPTQTSAFGQPSQGPTAFGQPSQPAQPTPAFGQPSQPQSAFGQPSALGAKPSPFGAPAFGQPSQPGAQGSAFGQPSQLGQKANPFASSANTNSNASPFAAAGNNNATANPFGAASSNQNNAQPSPFASNANTQNNNNASPFGQPSQPASNPFGQPSAPPAANPFASASQPSTTASNPFAQQSKQPANGFASQNQQSSNPFGQPSQPSSFGQPSGPGSANQQATPFNAAQSQRPAAASAGLSSPYPPESTKQHPPVESYASKGMDGRLSMFKGKSVVYKDDKPGIRGFDGTWRRIWFPNGPPGYSKDTELLPDQYDEKSKAQWTAFAQKGNFEGGLMPELPPPRECTVWDF